MKHRHTASDFFSEEEKEKNRSNHAKCRIAHDWRVVVMVVGSSDLYEEADLLGGSPPG